MAKFCLWEKDEIRIFIRKCQAFDFPQSFIQAQNGANSFGEIAKADFRELDLHV